MRGTSTEHLLFLLAKYIGDIRQNRSFAVAIRNAPYTGPTGQCLVNSLRRKPGRCPACPCFMDPRLLRSIRFRVALS